MLSGPNRDSILLADLSCLLLSLAQISFNLGTVPQIVTDHGIDFGQLEGWILIEDLLSRCTFDKGNHISGSDWVTIDKGILFTSAGIIETCVHPKFIRKPEDRQP
jgi:hypothetical protein